MAQYRLRYEFAHLGQDYSNGFDNTTWMDFTDHINEPDNVVFSFGISSAENTNQLDSTGIDKGVSSRLEVFGEAYKYTRRWLIDHGNASINSLQVRITDMVCIKSLGVWEIKPDNLSWCEGEECKMTLQLSEYTPLGNCLKNTLIADNKRNWFPDDGVLDGKQDGLTGQPVDANLHPRQRYCDEMPGFIQTVSFLFAQLVIGFIAGLVAPIIAAAQLIQGIINFVGGSGTADFADDLEEKYNDLFESITSALLGCNRYHPTPFVRTYFTNACSICGVEFVSEIFNDPASRYYNTRMLSAPVKEGFKLDQAPGKAWIQDNKPNETVITYAESLKRMFNAKYKLENGKFVFNVRNSFPDVTVFDFTQGEDRALLLAPICYSWNTHKKPASQTFELGDDAYDLAGNKVKHRYNGAKDWATNNPFYEGIDAIKAEKYSAARFTQDGVKKKLAFTIGGMGSMSKSIEWAEDCMLLEKDQTMLYKLLTYDGVSDEGWVKTSRVHPSQYYLDLYQNDWLYGMGTYGDHYIYNFALFYDPYNNDGFAKNGQALPYSWPNLFAFHRVDDPTQSGIQNKSWSITLELCCKTLNKIIYNDAAQDGIMAHLDYLVQLNAIEKGSINSIELNYENMEIRIKGEIKYTA